MADSMLQKLEEKIVTLVSEMDELRKELQRVKQENTLLCSDKSNHMQKLQSLVTLLEAVDVTQEVTAHEHMFASSHQEEVVAQ